MGRDGPTFSAQASLRGVHDDSIVVGQEKGGRGVGLRSRPIPGNSLERDPKVDEQAYGPSRCRDQRGLSSSLLRHASGGWRCGGMRCVSSHVDLSLLRHAGAWLVSAQWQRGQADDVRALPENCCRVFRERWSAAAVSRLRWPSAREGCGYHSVEQIAICLLCSLLGLARMGLSGTTGTDLLRSHEARSWAAPGQRGHSPVGATPYGCPSPCLSALMRGYFVFSSLCFPLPVCVKRGAMCIWAGDSTRPAVMA